MGPLVPYLLSNEFSLIVALLVGIGFGFVLEQAGFSSTKKLVGLFYGYDFTVLKVFFTAGVTAMIGILLFAHWGILDINLIYINPTFLWSALVGGAIMGVGFIVGGFCPGTSVCAAAIGKLDGLAFVFGSVFGVLAFAEWYPVFEKIYLTEAWGPVLINEKLGLSKIVFAFVLSAFAFIAFYLTRLIENRVNGVRYRLPRKMIVKYASAIGFAFFILLIIVLTPTRSEKIETRVTKEMLHVNLSDKIIPADKLASEIINNYYRINLIDLRTPDEFKVYHLPFAINIPVDKLNEIQWKKVLNQQHKTNYFYADNSQTAKKGFLLAEHFGKASNYILSENPAEFKRIFSELTPPKPNANKQEHNIYIFRKKAADDMALLIEALKNSSQPVVVKASKIKGGC